MTQEEDFYPTPIPELKAKTVNKFSPPFRSGPHCSFSHTVSAAHSSEKSVSLERMSKSKIPMGGVILAKGQSRESACMVMDATTTRTIVAAISQEREPTRAIKPFRRTLVAFGDFSEVLPDT